MIIKAEDGQIGEKGESSVYRLRVVETIQLNIEFS